MFLSIHDFEALSSAADDSESIEQIKRILTQFAGEEQAKKLEDGPTQIAFSLLQDYGATLMKTQASNWENRRILQNPQLQRRSEIRADFAKAGWSLDATSGRRLRYADAISLHEAMSVDPSTYTGASAWGSRSP